MSAVPESEMTPNVRAVHPLAASFPMLPEDELLELADDIATNGLVQPIMLDRDGRLIDGRNRLKACDIAQVAPTFETFDGDEAAVVAYIISTNVNRRHLNKGQRAMAVAMAYPDPEPRGRGNKSVIITDFAAATLSHARTVLRVDPQAAASVLAGAVALQDAYDNARQHDQAINAERHRHEKLQRDRPDLAEQVTAGEMSLEAAEAVVKADAEKIKVLRITITQLVIDATRINYPLAHVDHVRTHFDEALAESLGHSVTADVLDSTAAFLAALAAKWRETT